MVAVALLYLSARFLPGAFLGAKILHFCIGMCCYLALDRRAERGVWTGIAVGLSLAVVAVGGVLQMIPLAIWSAVLISSAALPHRPAHWLASALSSKLAVHFGEISYSLYLVHMIPLYSAIFVLTRLGAPNVELQIAVALATLLGAYLIARVTSITLEKPGIALGAKLARRQVQVATHPPSKALPLVDGTH